MKRRRMLILVAGLALAAGAWLLLAHSGEPRYEGKTVSYWFREAVQSGDDDANAKTAFAAMGTNALPFLLREAFTHDKDSLPREFLMAISRLLPETMNVPRLESDEEIQREAISLVERLELSPAQLLPLVEDQLKQTNAFQYRVAIGLLGDTKGDPDLLIPIFTRALHNYATQRMSLSFINQLGPRAGAMVPDLMQLIKNEELHTTIANTELKWTLGRIGSNAIAAVPMLKYSFDHETNAILNTKNAAVLYKIDPRQHEALSFVTNCLMVTNDDGLVASAARSIAFIGSEANSATPALLRAFETTNSDLQEMILHALVAVKAPMELVKEKARINFDSKDDSVRESAAEFVLERDPNDNQAQAVLTDLITNHSEEEEAAIDALGNAGPAARSQINAILEAFSVKGYYKWSDAPEALAKMGAPSELAINKLNDAIGADVKSHPGSSRAYENMAIDLLRLSPANKNAQLELLLWSETDLMALHYLAKANPPIPEVVPAVRRALTNKNAQMRIEAAAALKQIEAREKGKK